MHNTIIYIFFIIGPNRRRLYITETMNRVSSDRNEARRIPTSDVDEVMAGLSNQLAEAWDEAAYFKDFPQWSGCRFEDVTLDYEKVDS